MISTLGVLISSKLINEQHLWVGFPSIKYFKFLTISFADY